MPNTSLGYKSTTRIRARDDGSVELLTSKGEVVIVDGDVLQILPKGCLHIAGNGYARIQTRKNNKCKNLLIHRVILGLVSFDGLEVDHINMDKLDNRRANLRLVTRSVNQLNKTKAFSSNSTGFLGVHIDRRRVSKPFRASIELNGKKVTLGSYATAEEAHSVYMLVKNDLISSITKEGEATGEAR